MGSVQVLPTPGMLVVHGGGCSWGDPAEVQAFKEPPSRISLWIGDPADASKVLAFHCVLGVCAAAHLPPHRQSVLGAALLIFRHFPCANVAASAL